MDLDDPLDWVTNKDEVKSALGIGYAILGQDETRCLLALFV